MNRPEVVIEKVILDLLAQYSLRVRTQGGPPRPATTPSLGVFLRNPAAKKAFLNQLRLRLKSALGERLNNDQLKTLRSVNIPSLKETANTPTSLAIAIAIAHKLGLLPKISKTVSVHKSILSSRSSTERAAFVGKSSPKHTAAKKKRAPKRVFRERDVVLSPPRVKRGNGSADSEEYQEYDLGDGGDGGGSNEDSDTNGSAPSELTSPGAGKPKSKSRDENTTLVRIFYATDRKSKTDKIAGINYTAARSGSGLNFGECEISIPKLHKTGRLESPSILKLEFRPNPKKHIVLAAITTMKERAFLAKVAEVVAGSPKKEAFIFIHGYNVTFEDAARRTGQFAFDLKFSGAPILYSWPSDGTFANYPADENNAIWTVRNLTRFLSLLVQHTTAKRIHIIAHSMGNRAVCDALDSLSKLNPKRKKALLHHLVLAAPDIDADTFRNLASALMQTSGHVTLYASSRDKAIKASKLLHKNPRAGAPPMVISPPMDSIDASSVKTDFFSHGYFGDSWPVLNDIYELVGNDRAAADRFALIETTSAEGGIYYVFKQ